MHVGWVPDGNGGHRGQVAVLVRPDGLLGRACMTAIKPFRYALVYPAFLGGIERRWRTPTRRGRAGTCRLRPPVLHEDLMPIRRTAGGTRLVHADVGDGPRCSWCTPGR